MRFLNDLKGQYDFYGTGEKNRAGQDLEEFLEHYNAKKYDMPSNTTDVIVVRSKEKLVRWGQPIKVLLVKRSNHPSIGYWATPGGFVEMRESLREGAARELEEETGVKGLPLQQLRTWGDFERDPRWRVITTTFLSVVEGELEAKAADDAADALWFDVELVLESVDTEDGKIKELWKLRLANPEQGITIGARVCVGKRKDCLLPQESYELVETDQMAVDHGCLVVQALLYLKERLEEQR